MTLELLMRNLNELNAIFLCPCRDHGIKLRILPARLGGYDHLLKFSLRIDNPENIIKGRHAVGHRKINALHPLGNGKATGFDTP